MQNSQTKITLLLFLFNNTTLTSLRKEGVNFIEEIWAFHQDKIYIKIAHNIGVSLLSKCP